MQIEGEATAPKCLDVEKKPGRAFIHKVTGKYLAESGMNGSFLVEKLINLLNRLHC